MTPQEIASFVGGFDLNSANYSGGAGGTFANLVSGAEIGTVQGATPTFNTYQGMEGVTFAGGDSTETIRFDWPCPFECTIVGHWFDIGNSVTRYFVGGTYASGNTNRVGTYAKQATCATASTGTPWTAASAHTDRPNVFAASYSPADGKLYCTLNASETQTTQLANHSDAHFADSLNDTWMLGGHRTSYSAGWLGRILFFSRALHYRDPENFAALMTSELALIGL